MAEAGATISESFTDYADEDLLVVISMKDAPAEQNAAFREFYRRYRTFLYGAVRLVCKNISNGPHTADDIFSLVTVRVLAHAGTFSTRGVSDKAEVVRTIKGWLMRIAKNTLLQVLREENKRTGANAEISLEEGKDIASEEDETTPSFGRELVTHAMNTIGNERDRHILMVYWEYHEPGQGKSSKESSIRRTRRFGGALPNNAREHPPNHLPV
ncbi:MAG: sigma-70 family RNA polymerase sigma factor [Flavobacteriales bacterium]|nr:sigma-70 family RNA polymerase sigma factor [Flavobacteriales bacterium]